jgi:hypothetical protein
MDARSGGYRVCGELKWTYPGLGKELPVLAWMLMVYVLSLPQSVVLWTEPEEPAGELAEVRAGSR